MEFVWRIKETGKAQNICCPRGF